MEEPVAIIRGQRGQACKRKARRRRGGAASPGSLPVSAALNRVNSITNRIPWRKSRTGRREDAAGGEDGGSGEGVPDENQTFGHRCLKNFFLSSSLIFFKGFFPFYSVIFPLVNDTEEKNLD